MNGMINGLQSESFLMVGLTSAKALILLVDEDEIILKFEKEKEIASVE